MNARLLILAALLAFGVPALGKSNETVDAPQDDYGAFGGVNYDPEVVYDNELVNRRNDYQDFLRWKMSLFTVDELTKQFGPRLEHRPSDMVCSLPMYSDYSTHLRESRQTNVFALGTNGYLEVCVDEGSTTADSFVLFLRRDASFVAFKSAPDLQKRLAWEKPKLTAMTNWLEEHLPKPVDLGIVDFSTNFQVTVRLPNGTNHIIAFSYGILAEPGPHYLFTFLPSGSDTNDFMRAINDTKHHKFPQIVRRYGNVGKVERWTDVPLDGEPMLVRWDGTIYQFTMRAPESARL